MTEIQGLLVAAIQMIAGSVITALAATVIAYIRKKAKHITSTINNETARHCIAELEDAVTAAVARTSQTYVDELKKIGAFLPAAQASALMQSRDNALALVTPATREYLQKTYDLHSLIDAKIEHRVRASKMS